jgi:hypothetical protein
LGRRAGKMLERKTNFKRKITIKSIRKQYGELWIQLRHLMIDSLACSSARIGWREIVSVVIVIILIVTTIVVLIVTGIISGVVSGVIIGAVVR